MQSELWGVKKYQNQKIGKGGSKGEESKKVQRNVSGMSPWGILYNALKARYSISLATVQLRTCCNVAQMDWLVTGVF